MNQQAIEKQPITVLDFVREHTADFAQVLPKHLNAERMSRLALSAIRTTRHLSECSIQSVAVSLMACSALGLEPNTPLGHAYLIPYRCNVAEKGEPKRYEWRCQLVVGYKGYIELFYRSGVVDFVQAFPVFVGDEFRVTYGLDNDLVHIPSTDPLRWRPEKLTHVYAVIRVKDQPKPLWTVLDRAQIELHRSRSMARDSGPWVTDYIKMALKTAIRDITPWVPFAVDRAAIASVAEAAFEASDPAKVVIALGPDAIDATDHLLAGVPDDAPPVPDEPASTLEDLVAENREKNKSRRQPKSDADES